MRNFIPTPTNPRNYGKPRICPNLLKNPKQPCPAGKKTHTYYGRGYTQLTHFGNYQKLSDKLGLGEQLIHYPERANEPDITYSIMEHLPTALPTKFQLFGHLHNREDQD